MPTRKSKPYTFEQFLAVRRYAPTLTFAPDGREVAYITNTSGQFNLWRQEARGGYPIQLTMFADRTVRDLAWAPDGTTLAFNADLHGNEMHQLFVIPARGGAPEQLTNVEDVWHFVNPRSWSPNGRFLGYSANDRERRDMDILVRDMQTGETARVLEGAFFDFASWSPRGRHALAVKVMSNSNTDIYLIDAPAREARNLTEHEGEVFQVPVGWNADGSGFYLVSDAGREFKGLAFYDLISAQTRWVETPRWDVEFADVSRGGRWLAWATNKDGYSKLFGRSLRSGKLLSLPELPRGVLLWLAFSPDGGRLGLVLARATHCTEIYVLDLRTKTLKQITHSMLGGMDERDLVEPRRVHYETFDGRKIPAYLYRPKNADGRVPVIVSIHGGPEWQERPAYNYAGMYQYLLDRGIGVLAPNIRGSTGYGKSYQKLIHRDWGGGELRDIEHAAKYLQSLEWVDPARLGVFGGSFGGFATLSAVSRLPDYWAAAVDIVGPANLMTFVQSVPPSWQRFMDEWVGNVEKDRDLLVERSPITYAHQIKTPLFVIQGANDPRVVKAESDQMVEQLQARGVPVKYDVYADEGHGFTKRENELKALRDTAEFFEQRLLG